MKSAISFSRACSDHLSVSDADSAVREHFAQPFGGFGNRLDAVVEVENLPPARDLALHRVPHGLGGVFPHESLHPETCLWGAFP